MSDIAVQASFNSGEWAPALFARVDIQKWRSGAALLKNFFVDYRGGASTRPGTHYIISALSDIVRLIPFQVTSTVGYMLEFGDFYIRFIFQDAMVLEDPFAITAITQANPCVVTAPGHNFVVGDRVFITGVLGMTLINNRYFAVTSVAGATVTLAYEYNGAAFNSTPYGVYTSAGTIARVYVISSPYSMAQLADLKYAQTVNQMILCHPDFDPYLLTENAPTDWTIAPIVIGSTAFTPDAPTVTSSLGAGTTNYAYVVTAVDGNGAESLPSAQGDLLNTLDMRTTPGSNQVDFGGEGGAAYYRIYKADVSYLGAVPPGAVFGYIGYTTSNVFVDTNIAPDFSLTPPSSINPFAPQGSVTGIAVTVPGTYTSFPKVTIIGSATTSATAFATMAVHGTPTVAAGGAGYAVNDTITLGNGVVVVVNTIGGGGTITSFKAITVSPSNPGAIGPPGPIPANPRPQVSTSGAGTGATVNLAWGVGSITVTNPGAGYTATPSVQIGAGAGGAVATATLTTTGNAHPTVPSFFQERLVLAASPSRPQTFWMSHPGQFFNFNQSNPIRPDDMIEGTLVSGVLNTIQSMQSQTSGLLMLTDNGSWIITGGSDGSAVSPANIVARTQSYIGANAVRPIVANYDVLHVQQKGSSVRDLAFNIYFNVFTGSDISIISSHLFLGYQITEWCWAEEPYKLVWAVRDDGVLLTCTFMKEQEFTAWSHHTTDGTVMSIGAVVEQTADIFVDAVYLAVQREVQSAPSPPAAPTTVFITSSPFVVPADWNNAANAIHAIAGGGGGRAGNPTSSAGDGGGGAAWTRLTNVVLTPGASIPIQIGQGGLGGATQSANGIDGTDTIFDTLNNTIVAKAGKGATIATGRGSGGDGAACTPAGHSGGRGGAGGSAFIQEGGGGGGGGAGGQNGVGAAGGAGGAANASSGGGGGGASDGGSIGVSAIAGAHNGGNGGAAFDTTPGGAGGVIGLPIGQPGAHGSGGGGGYESSGGGAGGAGIGYIQTSNSAVSGPGGGGGGSGANSPTTALAGPGGLYGGGGAGGKAFVGTGPNSWGPGSDGARGILAAIYTSTTPPPPPTANVTFIERMANRLLANSVNNSWAVDSGLGYSSTTPAATFAGGEHLTGRVVTGLGDDTVIGPFIMADNGIFTLPNAVTKMKVGIGFTCDLQTLPLDVGDPSVQGKVKKIPSVNVRIAETQNLLIGADFNTLTTMKDLVPGQVSSTLTGQGNQIVGSLVSGDAMTVLNPTYTVPGQYCIRQNLPLPATILGVFPDVVQGDDR